MGCSQPGKATARIIPPFRENFASPSLGSGAFPERWFDMFGVKFSPVKAMVGVVRVAMVAVCLFGASVAAFAADSVWLKDSSGTLVDRTSSVVLQDPIVYDAATSVEIGWIDSYGYIHDVSSGDVIGLISTGS